MKEQRAGRRVPILMAGTLLAFVAVFPLACTTTSESARASTFAKKRGSLAANASALNLRVDLIPKGRYGRKKHRPMRPRYITVHSTQTYVASANARTHANALKNGSLTATNNLLGYLTWHFTVDQTYIYQSLPCTERGEHADYEGKGNKTSIGIEMCENRGNSRSATVERTAKLVAVLMAEYGIPLSRVVPHYHWERIQPKTGKNIGHKNCPHFLMDNGRPGKKWQGFLAKVNKHYQKLRRTGKI